MNLSDRRIVKRTEEKLPELQKEIHDLCGGGEIHIHIDFESFSADPPAIEEVEYNVIGEIINGLRSVCIDDLGKEAVREHLKKIDVKNIQEGEKRVAFADGTLHVEGGWGKLGARVFEAEVKQVLEKSL